MIMLLVWIGFVCCLCVVHVLENSFLMFLIFLCYVGFDLEKKGNEKNLVFVM